MYFQIVNQTTGIGLWQSDGTSEGTTLIINMSAIHYQNIFDETNKILVDGNRFFFIGNDILHSRELWTYNTYDNLTNVQSIKLDLFPKKHITFQRFRFTSPHTISQICAI